jgi:cytidyltransferase-like protein
MFRLFVQSSKSGKLKNKMILYADMVGDLFHYGHVEFLMQIYLHKKKEDKVYIGVHSDAVVESYKRRPIMKMEERIKVLQPVTSDKCPTITFNKTLSNKIRNLYN